MDHLTDGRAVGIERIAVQTPFQAFAQLYSAPSIEEAVTRACDQLRCEVKELVAPIGLQKLLRHFDARVIQRPLPTAGRLEIDDQGYQVVIRKGVAWRRQRFTVAHEIGHIIFLEALAADPPWLSELRKDEYWKELERLCNLVAADLLVPRDDFLASVRVFRPDGSSLRQLYDRYLCSFSTLFIRFIDLFPGLSISLWRNLARHDGEDQAWRVARCFSSDVSTWMPNGMTGKHLLPNIIRSAVTNGACVEPNLVFDLSGRKRNVCGVAIRLTPRSRSEICNPMFEGMEVPDEPLSEPVVTLFAWPRSLFETTCKPLMHLCS